LGQLVQVVLLEQSVVVLIGLAAGSALGIGMSYLFLPFLQVSYAEKLPPPPLLVQIAWQDMWRVYALIGAALVVAIMGLIGSLLRLKVFEAIKMGEAQSL
jgi:putative ABC transport system permease protein